MASEARGKFNASPTHGHKVTKHAQRYTAWMNSMYAAEEAVEQLYAEAEALDRNREADGVTIDEVMTEYAAARAA